MNWSYLVKQKNHEGGTFSLFDSRLNDHHTPIHTHQFSVTLNMFFYVVSSSNLKCYDSSIIQQTAYLLSGVRASTPITRPHVRASTSSPSYSSNFVQPPSNGWLISLFVAHSTRGFASRWQLCRCCVCITKQFGCLMVVQLPAESPLDEYHECRVDANLNLDKCKPVIRFHARLELQGSPCLTHRDPFESSGKKTFATDLCVHAFVSVCSFVIVSESHASF